MSITALTGLVPEWFTPDAEKESDTPARFKVKPLDSKQMVEIQMFHKESGGISPEGLYRAMEISILEWENVFGVNEKPLKCTRHNVKVIPIEIIAEIGAHAISISFLSEDDEKN